MSSNDFDGPYRPAGARGTDDKSGGARGAGRNGDGNRGGYAPPEGWGDDGFWRDSSVDANYETGALQSLGQRGRRAAGNGRASAPSDHRGGRHSQRGNGAQAPAAPVPGGYGPPNGGYGPGNGRGAGNGHAPGGGYGPNGGHGPGNDATAFFGAPGAGAAYGDDATRFEQAPTGYREAVRRFTGPITGPITDGWRRIGDRMGGRGPGGPEGPEGPGGPGSGPGGPRGPRGPRPGIGPDGRRIKRRGDWWRRWTWKKALAFTGASVGVFALIAVGVIYYLYSSTPIPTTALASDFVQNSTVYFSDGSTVVGSFGAEHRQLLTFNQIPKAMQDATLAAEERGYWTDGAISPTGILRAAYDDATSSGGNLSGGSTITQEFVRQYYQDIGTQQTASRKIKEIFVAEKLAKSESKQWILTNFLNTIYLGDDAYGVAAAAQTYFGEPISKITLAQAAVIAAIIQEPSDYPLPQYRPNLIARWHYVLSGLVKMGDISAQQAATMKFPAMNTNPSAGYAGSQPWDSYIMAEVDSELTQVDHISQDKLDTGGLKIVLTVSPQHERELYKSVDDIKSEIRNEGYQLPDYALIGAQEENPANGDIEAIYGGPGENMPAKQCKAVDCDENTTINTIEQVGSSFKPYVLSAAVQEGMNVKTSVLNANARLWVPPASPQYAMTLSATSAAQAVPSAYPVHNDSYEQIGPTSVQNAIAQSSNTAFTDLAHRVQLEPIRQMAKSEGGVDLVQSGLQGDGGVGMALGIDSLTVNDQASMMATIDDNGVYHASHMVASITQPGGAVTHPQVDSHQSLTEAQDSQVQYALLDTVINGTATAARMDDGRPTIGKTGTTTGSKSAFFIGAIPQDVLAVGIFTELQGNSNPETLTALGGGGFGGTWPAAIWHEFADTTWGNLPVQNFLTPEFSGQAWIQVPKAPKKKKKPATKPTSTPTPPGHHHHPTGGPTLPTASSTPTAPSTPTSSPTFPFGGGPSSSPTATTSPTAGTGGGGPGGGGGHGGTAGATAGGAAQTVSAEQAGLGFGGTLLVLPGSLLWVRAARRRRRKPSK